VLHAVLLMSSTSSLIRRPRRRLRYSDVAGVNFDLFDTPHAERGSSTNGLNTPTYICNSLSRYAQRPSGRTPNTWCQAGLPPIAVGFPDHLKNQPPHARLAATK